MNLQELIISTGQVPDRGTTDKGIKFEVDVVKNEKLGYMATMWEVKGLRVKEFVIEYGTGNTPEAAKDTLKKKILKSL